MGQGHLEGSSGQSSGWEVGARWASAHPEPFGKRWDRTSPPTPSLGPFCSPCPPPPLHMPSHAATSALPGTPWASLRGCWLEQLRSEVG